MEEIKSALVKAYGTDSFMAFDQLTTCCLCLEGNVDEFLMGLQHMALLVGEMPPKCWMKGAFINRLPTHVKGLLPSSA